MTDRGDSINDRALIVSDDAEMQRVLHRTLQQANWEVEICSGRKDWLSSASQGNWLFIIICVEKDCLRAIEILEEFQDEIIAERSFAIVIAKRPSIHDAILCIQSGAADYLPWPILPSQIIEIAARARRQGEYELKEEHRTPLEGDTAYFGRK